MDTVAPRHGFQLLPHEEFDPLVRRMAMRHPVDTRTATYLVDQALAFVATVGELAKSGEIEFLSFSLRLPEEIDWAWCELLTDTVVHHKLADRLDYFVHRDPVTVQGERDVEMTAAAMVRLGWVTYLKHWMGKAAAASSALREARAA